MRAVVSVVVLLVLVACGASEPEPAAPASTAARASTTEQAVEALMRALEDGDCATVKTVVVRRTEIDCAQVGEASGMLVAEGTDIDEVRYADGEITGDSATVTITWRDDLPAETIDLQRVDGRWLVVFDSSP